MNFCLKNFIYFIVSNYYFDNLQIKKKHKNFSNTEKSKIKLKEPIYLFHKKINYIIKFILILIYIYKTI